MLDFELFLLKKSVVSRYVNSLKLKDSERGGKYFTQKPDICKAVKEAKSALDLSVVDRLKLVVCRQSDEEEEEEEEEQMEVNGNC